MESTQGNDEVGTAVGHEVVEVEAAEVVSAQPPQALAPAGSSSSDLDRMVAYDARKKSMGTAYVLWWLFGAFGGHRFYLGKTGSGTAMLCITVLSLVLMIVLIGFITILITAIWALVDAFMIAGWVRDHNAEVARSLGVSTV